MAPAVQLARAARYGTHECYGGALLAEGYLLAGEYEKARQTSDEVIEIATRMGAKIWLGWSHRILGEVALKTNPDQAAPHFEESISIFREIKAQNKLAKAYSGMGRLHKLRGEYAEARRYLTQALEIFERLGTLIEPDKVRKELAELPA